MYFFSRKAFIFILTALILTACSAQETPAVLYTPPVSITATTLPTPTKIPAPAITATPTPSGCQESTGSISVENVPSSLIKPLIEVRVYTPPCYSAALATRYPVLYMLHGQTYDDTQWQNLGLTDNADKLITSGQISPLIIVMPNEAASMKDADSSQFGAALINEIIPWIDSHYATCDVRECRAIGGLSRGGNWAVRIGLSHPDYFEAIGAHSAPLFYGDLTRVSSWIKAIPAGAATPMIYIDFGRSDEEKDDMLQFDQELNDLGVAHQMVQFNGFHDNNYWSAHVADYLRWYSAALARPQQ